MNLRTLVEIEVTLVCKGFHRPVRPDRDGKANRRNGSRHGPSVFRGSGTDYLLVYDRRGRQGSGPNLRLPDREQN